MKELVCTSCKKHLNGERGVVRFLCPNCHKAEIIRCEHCRKIVAKYKCPECGFEGPN
ncbi:RNA-binding protein [Candidatus Woesearchaeota archaeon]|nr:MAG: RNA-binding protein [Candidatus Woesearchaeota archaeon]